MKPSLQVTDSDYRAEIYESVNSNANNYIININ